MEYNYTEKDALGNVVSIDNLVCEWQYAGPEKKLRSAVLDAFQKCCDGFDPLKDVQFDKPTANKYSWFRNAVWGDGVLVRWDKFRTLSKTVETRAILQIEVNPNKHWHAPVIHQLLDLVKECCTHGTLRKYDVAVDVPVRIEHVSIDSRKKTSQVKGTRYYGERNKHGHLRVYDKKAELSGRGSEIDSDELTRLEWTFHDGKPISFDDVGLRFFDSFDSGYGLLSANGKMTADLCSLLLEKGVKWDEIEPFLNRSTRKTIEPAVRGAYIRLCVSHDLVFSLLEKYCSELMVAYRDSENKYVNHRFTNDLLKVDIPGSVARPGN